MYHYITIWSLVINMTWLWVIVFLAVFLGVIISSFSSCIHSYHLFLWNLPPLLYRSILNIPSINRSNTSLFLTISIQFQYYLNNSLNDTWMMEIPQSKRKKRCLGSLISLCYSLGDGTFRNFSPSVRFIYWSPYKWRILCVCN